MAGPVLVLLLCQLLSATRQKVLEREMSSVGGPAPILPAALTMVPGVPGVLQEPKLTLVQLFLFLAGTQGLWNVPGLCQT